MSMKTSMCSSTACVGNRLCGQSTDRGAIASGKQVRAADLFEKSQDRSTMIQHQTALTPPARNRCFKMPPDPSASSPICDHPACLPEEKLLEDCDVQRTRASGPGGQHRNKTETAIQMTHRPTGLTALAYERRSQEDNRKVAIFRMRLTLAALHRTVKSRVVEPTALWESRCPKGKISCNESHSDFPSLIAEAMNAVDAKSFDVRLAAAALGCSTSQLVRFIAKSSEAFLAFNAGREQAGLRKLKP